MDAAAIAVPPEKEKKDDSSEKKDEKKDGDKSDKDKEKDKKDGKSGDKSGKPAAHQIWLISPEGGEAWQLTRHETDVQDFDWSKDGKQIAFTASAKESKADKDRKSSTATTKSLKKITNRVKSGPSTSLPRRRISSPQKRARSRTTKSST